MAKYLLRLGELTLKSDQTRKHFLAMLISNLEKSFMKIGISDFKIENEWSRLFVESNNPKIEEVIQTTFGLVSYSKVTETKPGSIDEMVKFGKTFFSDDVAGRAFAVRARVSSSNLHSKDIEIALGASLKSLSKKVDLDNPEFTAYIELRGNKAYFFKDKISSPGGLPLGSEGKILSLISGGFDSAVASYLMMKRGCEVDFLFFNLGGSEHLKGVYEVSRFLRERWERPYKARMISVDFADVLRNIYEKTNKEYWNILLKRFMFIAADKISENEAYEGFVTGSSIGQVSSQTLQNFGVTTHGLSEPNFHPLIGFDKTEIIKLAQHIGTYSLSEHVKEFCAISTEHPSTHAKLEIILREMSEIPASILNNIIKEKKIYTLPSSELESGLRKVVPIIEVEPPYINDRIVLDMRSDESRKKDPINGAIKIELWEVFHLDVGRPSERPTSQKLDKEKKYLALCEGGVKSKYAAAFLRAHGYDAESAKTDLNN